MTWLAIESAPKDGTKILGYGPRGAEVWRWNRQPYHQRPNPYWERSGGSVTADRANQPTHWCPLPPPPSAEPVTSRDVLEPERYWLIHYEDRDVPHEVFTDEAAARGRYEQRLTNWNCSLFAQVTQPSGAPLPCPEHGGAK